MGRLLVIPWVLVSELIDALMWLIPQRVWDWLWREAVETGDAELARATDTMIRVAMGLLLVGGVAFFVGSCVWG